tara:strand:- start:50 stop:535 length:486 start_codon:yes stop_codon:yes gene_type:complete
MKMKESDQMFVGVTVGRSQIDDLFLAVGLVEGVEIVHTAKAFTPRNNPHKGRAGLSAATTPKVEPKPAEPSVLRRAITKARVQQGDPRVVSCGQQRCDDPRVVYRRSVSGAIVLDIDATLSNIGLTADQLDAMETRQGTVENSVKRSLSAQRGGLAGRRAA